MGTIVLLYLVTFRPFMDERMTSLELLNEVTFLMAAYCLVCFSDFVPEVLARNNIG